MANFEWDDNVQASTNTGLSEEIELMSEANVHILRCLPDLEENWNTPGAKVTINNLRTFLENDFKMFYDYYVQNRDSLEQVRKYTQMMSDVGR